jgi:hypothetical protein
MRGAVFGPRFFRYVPLPFLGQCKNPVEMLKNYQCNYG